MLKEKNFCTPLLDDADLRMRVAWAYIRDIFLSGKALPIRSEATATSTPFCGGVCEHEDVVCFGIL